jgi:ATP-dependent Clp protease ATP-binding subunit ClpA
MEIAERIVDKQLLQLEERLQAKKVILSVEASGRRFLAEKGFDAQFGARPVKRLIEKEIAEKLSEEILFGNLQNGGTVTVSARADGLDFKITPPSTEIKLLPPHTAPVESSQ